MKFKEFLPYINPHIPIAFQAYATEQNYYYKYDDTPQALHFQGRKILDLEIFQFSALENSLIFVYIPPFEGEKNEIF